MSIKCWCDRCGNEIPMDQSSIGWTEEQYITDGRFIVRVDTRGCVDREKPFPQLCPPCQIDIVRNGTPYVEKDEEGAA
jgi:hypothetical protein